MFEMIALPYNMNDLEPYVSQQTFEYHYGSTYLDFSGSKKNLVKPFCEKTSQNFCQT